MFVIHATKQTVSKCVADSIRMYHDVDAEFIVKKALQDDVLANNSALRNTPGANTAKD